MKNFLKKFIKPIFYKTGTYKSIYNFYFFIINIFIKLYNHFNKMFFKTAPILLYHRIDNVSFDPVMLCVTPKSFEEHLKFLKENYEIIPLLELSERIYCNKLKGNEAAITFDDGYKDNLTNALPLLEKYNIPATIFITTGHLGEKASFEWDMEYSEEDRAIFLSEEDIKLLSKNKLIEIGAHTDSHIRLSDIPKEKQREEILRSKTVLEKIIERNVNVFAYPFGNIYDFNNISKNISKELGFKFAFSNTQMISKHTKNNLCISRINIRECNTIELSKKLFTFSLSFFKNYKK